jgi:hypothetical protein
VLRPLLRLIDEVPRAAQERLVRVLADLSAQHPVEETAAPAAELGMHDVVIALADRSCTADGTALRRGLKGVDPDVALRLLRIAAGRRDDAAAWLVLVLHDGPERDRLTRRLSYASRRDTHLSIGTIVLAVPETQDRLELARQARMQDSISDLLLFFSGGRGADLQAYVAFRDAAGLDLTPEMRQRAALLRGESAEGVPAQANGEAQVVAAIS